LLGAPLNNTMQTGTILYHTAGSGGDIIGTAWTMNPDIISAVRYSGTNAAGRAVITWDQSVLEQFPRTPYRHWYSRNWQQDLDRLSNLEKPFFFNVCDIEQARLISTFQGSCKTHWCDLLQTALAICVGFILLQSARC